MSRQFLLFLISITTDGTHRLLHRVIRLSSCSTRKRRPASAIWMATRERSKMSPGTLSIPVRFILLRRVTWLTRLYADMLATASRDGSIRIWDRRTASKENTNRAGDANVATVNLIKNAHAIKGKTTKNVSSFPLFAGEC